MLDEEAIVTKFRFDEVVLNVVDMLTQWRVCLDGKEYVRRDGYH